MNLEDPHMDAREQAFLQMMEVQRERYRRALPGKIAALEALWREAWLDGDAHARLEELLRGAHGLAGSGATFGLAEVGTQARILERRLQALLDSDGRPDPAQSAQVAAAMEMLKGRVATLQP